MKILAKIAISVVVFLLITTFVSDAYLKKYVLNSSKNTYTDFEITAAAVNYLAGSLLYSSSPVLTAIVEHVLVEPIFYGPCRVVNVIFTSTGTIAVGVARDSVTGKVEPHVRGYTNRSVIDYTCPTCDFISTWFSIAVENYKIKDYRIYSFNYKSLTAFAYIRTALFVNELKYVLRRL